MVVGGFSRNGRNANEMIAGRTLNLPSREILVAGQMLLAMGTGEFEFAHADEV